LEAALSLFRAQRAANINEKFVSTCEKEFKGAFDFVNTIQRHERQRKMPTTFGKSGIVNRSLVGYRYIESPDDKENNPVSPSNYFDLFFLF